MQKRAAFGQAVAPLALEDLVFLDEAGFSLSLYRLYGWGLRGVPLVEPVPSCRGKNLSILAAFDYEAMITSTGKLGAMKRVDFEAFLRRDLLPRLLPGSVLVLDKARLHHGGQIEKLVEKAKCRLLYLPPDSPDLSPIELAWSWIKNRVRQRAARDEASRQAAIDQAIAALPAAHAPAWFRHCGCLQS